MAELFFGCRLSSNQPVIHNSNPELVAERQPLDDSSRTRSVNFEPGDNVWVRLSPLENVWKQGNETQCCWDSQTHLWLR